MVKGSLKPFLLALSVTLVTNIFAGAVEAKSKGKGGAAQSQDSPVPAKSAPAANDAAPQVVQQWEQRLFFKKFADEDVNARLERIEKRIFGQAIEAALDERLSRLENLLKEKLSEEQKQKEAEARRAGVTSGGTTSASAKPADNAQPDKDEELERARISIQSAREQEIATLLADGVSFFRKKQGMQAQEKFEQVLRLDPTNAQAHFNLGIIEEAMGNFVEALASYKQAAVNDPGNREYDEAVSAIAKKASAQANSIGHRADLRALAEQANAAWKRGEYYSALDLYQQLDQKEPNRALVKYNIGSIYLMLKDPDSALVAYEAAARLEPGEQKYAKAYKELAAEIKRSSKEQAKAEATATAEWKQEHGAQPETPAKKGGGKKQAAQASQVPVQQPRQVMQQPRQQMAFQQPVQQPSAGIANRMMQQPGQNSMYGNGMSQQPNQRMQSNGYMQSMGAAQAPAQQLQQQTPYQQQGMMQTGMYPNGMMQQRNGMMQQPNGMMQSNGMMQQPNGMMQQRNGMMQQPNGMMQSNGMMQQPNSMMQSNGYMQQPNGMMQSNGMMQPNGMMQSNGMMQPNSMMQSNGYMQSMGSAQAPAQQLQQQMPYQRQGMMQQTGSYPNSMNQQPMQSMQQPMQSMQQPMQSMQQPMQSMQEPMQSMQEPTQAMHQQHQPHKTAQHPAHQQQQPQQESSGTASGGNAQAGSDMMLQFGFLGKSNGEGFTVLKVGNQSRAATAGLVVGDDIKAVDGIQVNNKEDVLQVLSNINPAKRIPVLIMRNGNLAVLNM